MRALTVRYVLNPYLEHIFQGQPYKPTIIIKLQRATVNEADLDTAQDHRYRSVFLLLSFSINNRLPG